MLHGTTRSHTLSASGPMSFPLASCSTVSTTHLSAALPLANLGMAGSHRSGGGSCGRGHELRRRRRQHRCGACTTPSMRAGQQPALRCTECPLAAHELRAWRNTPRAKAQACVFCALLHALLHARFAARPRHHSLAGVEVDAEEVQAALDERRLLRREGGQAGAGARLERRGVVACTAPERRRAGRCVWRSGLGGG